VYNSLADGLHFIVQVNIEPHFVRVKTRCCPWFVCDISLSVIGLNLYDPYIYFENFDNITHTPTGLCECVLIYAL